MTTRLLDDAPGANNIAGKDVNSPPVEMPVLRTNRRANGAFGLLVLLSLVCDFSMMPIVNAIDGPPILPGFAVFTAVLGSILAQGNLLAAWLAWTEGSFLTRLMRHWIIAALLYLVWVVGFGLSGIAQFNEITRVVGLFVPLVSLAAQTPLWIARETFGWRLVRDADNKSRGRSTLTIRRLMVATLVAAATFGLARLAPPIDKGPQWPLWAFAFVAAGSFSTLAIMPASAMLMRTRQMGRGLLFAGLYAGSYVSVLWAAVLTVRHFGFSVPPLAMVVAVSTFVFSFAATVMLAAVAARLYGYRLVRGRT